MGKKFGELAKIRGVIHYRLSPYEQNIFAGFFSKGIPNLARRIRSQMFSVVPRKFIICMQLFPLWYFMFAVNVVLIYKANQFCHSVFTLAIEISFAILLKSIR